MSRLERPSDPYNLATLGARVIAACVDLLCLILILLLCLGLGVVIPLSFPELPFFVFWIFVLLSIPLAGLYFLLCFYFFGKTLGCATVSIKIVRSDGAELGLSGGFLRTFSLGIYILGFPIGFSFLWVFDSMLLACSIVLLVSMGIGLASMLFMCVDRQRRALHDRMAGTLVVENF